MRGGGGHEVCRSGEGRDWRVPWEHQPRGGGFRMVTDWRGSLLVRPVRRRQALWALAGAVLPVGTGHPGQGIQESSGCLQTWGSGAPCSAAAGGFPRPERQPGSRPADTLAGKHRPPPATALSPGEEAASGQAQDRQLSQHPALPAPPGPWEHVVPRAPFHK